MSTTDDLTTPGHTSADGSGAAVAAALGALGYGLFVWQQQGDLHEVAPFAVVGDGAVTTEPSDAVDVARLADVGAVGASVDVPDIFFDEDLAELDGSLDPADPAGLASTGAGVPADEQAQTPAPTDDAPSSYSTSPDTIAMLEEIAFLDE